MPNDKKKILLVEDEVFLAEIVRDYLLDVGYLVEMAHTGIGVVDRVRTSKPDLILLDLMLPGVDGLTICKEVRTFSDVPVIMLTAKITELDRLLGYDIGADDYICKPVSAQEILARVKAVLRRFEPRRETLADQLFVFDEERLVAKLNGENLDLTVVEFRLLRLLALKEGRVFSRSQIMDLIFDQEPDSSERSIDSHIKNLRKKIAIHFNEENPIHSVYGIGYKLEWSK